MERSAIFSLDRQLRYVLTRRWSRGKRMLLWIMLNPSSASAAHDDPTIRRCMTFAGDWGYDGIYVVNLFPYRTPIPTDLLRVEIHDGIELQNLQYIRQYQDKSASIVCAWGNGPILRKLQPNFTFFSPKYNYHFIKLSKFGVPMHPLYLPKKLQLQRWLDWEMLSP